MLVHYFYATTTTGKICFSVFLTCLASAPSRTLARRKLARNRFTIDTDLIFHGNNNNSSGGGHGGGDLDPSQLYMPLSQHALFQSQKPQGEDTDRWVEEQFDLRRFEDHGQGIDMDHVKETDILSDDDEYCKSVRAASAEPGDLDGKMGELGLNGRDASSHSLNRHLEAGPVVRRGEPQEEEVNRIKLVGQSDSVDSFSSCGVSLSHCPVSTITLGPLKQCAVEGATNRDQDVIWVRRDDFANGCNSDVF